MENDYVIGILNIVEDKLREFNIQIPDEGGGNNTKKWFIPVTWQMAGVVCIEADTLEEAIDRANNDDDIGLPSGDYVDSSFEVSYDDPDCIRQLYNHNQADREGSTDPIVGYQYAELHDRIKEYMEDAGLLLSPGTDPRKTTVHMLSVVNSDGFADGKDSETSVYSSFQDFLDSAYTLYEAIWKESERLEVLDGNSPMLSKEAFKAEMLGIGCVCIQCLDAHVSFEYFEQELFLNWAHTQAQKPSLAAQIESASSRSTNNYSHDNTPGKVSADTLDR